MVDISFCVLSPLEIQRYFPAEVEPPPANTFEIALVLGGTVSAGAYTAGVLDFLIEALDAWERTKAAEAALPHAAKTAPTHKVVLKLITGASGGGVNGAILLRSIGAAFAPYAAARSAADLARNPFYDTWVNRLDIAGMCADGDDPLISLLNPQPLDDASLVLANLPNPPLATPRAWVADPLRLAVTLTNLRGVPYTTAVDGARTGETFVNHADFIRFARFADPRLAAAHQRPDEYAVGGPSDLAAGRMDWPTFTTFIRATAAFPLGFPARALHRRTSDYRYRTYLSYDDSGAAMVVPATPDWRQLETAGALAATYDLAAVDGGATDNLPISLARHALAGMVKRNPRRGDQATRCLLLVDPFAQTADLGAPDRVASLLSTALLSVAGNTIGTLVGQTRYDTCDLLLAADPTVFSRFLITPSRRSDALGETVTGGDAIATSGVNAFIGFFSQDFRLHDFQLGRANCQAYLANEFALFANNPVFAGQAPGSDAGWRPFMADGVTYRPIIPLVGEAAEPQPVMAWPYAAFADATARRRFEDDARAVLKPRMDMIVTAAVSGLLGSSMLQAVANLLGHATAASWLTDKALSAISAAIDQKRAGG